MASIKVSAITSCFNGAKYLPEFLSNCAEQSIRDELEIVLVHNEPSAQEMEIVKSFQARYPRLINQIIVPKELIAVSTNRAIKAAKGEYVCVWNVDDLRTPDSLRLMARVLDEHQTIGFTYGDYIIVNQSQKQTGRYISAPEFKKLEFIQSMHLGPFYMWRKNLCASIGFWDEQMLQGGDFDYAVRLAIEAEGKKTHGLLGYYLDEGLGMSTKRATLQPIERTFVELRFGIYYKLDFWYYTRAKKYRLNKILENGQWVDVEKLTPHRKNFMQNKAWLIWAVIRYPVWLLRRAVNKIKRKML